MTTKRRKGERADGLIQISKVINGKRKYFYGKTRKEAEAKKAEYEKKLAENLPSKDTTVDEWVKQYLSIYRTKVNPLYYGIDDVPYNRLASKFQSIPLSSITELDLQLALNELSGMSFSTVDKYRQAIKRVFKKAFKNHLIKEDPACDLILPQYSKGTHRSLEQWEVQTIINNWNAPDQWAGLWVLIMMFCGLRRGEMMALDWKDVDLNARLITVSQVAVINKNKTVIEQRAKTAAGLRQIPISTTLYNILNSIPDKTGFVCLSSKGTQLTECSVERGIDKSMKVWSEICGKEIKFRTHDLRHTFATMLYESGVDVKTAQYLLGHADLKMTLELYTHLSESHKEEENNKVIDYIDRLKLEGDTK